MRREHRRRWAILGVAVLGVATTLVVARGMFGDEPSDRYPALSDAGGFLSCAAVPGGGAERLLVAHPRTPSTEPLPDDIRFTEILGSSPAGWSFQSVAFTGDISSIPMNGLLDQNADRAPDYDTIPLPFRPDGPTDFALGVIIDVPAETADNPPAAVEVTGARYDTGGASYTLEFDYEVFVTRLAQDDPDYCNQPGTLLQKSGAGP